MKRVRILTEKEIQQLEYHYKNAKKHHFRIRCQIILLSNEGLKVSEIANRLKKDVDTIYSWINRYDSQGFEGLGNRKGQGRTATLSDLTKDQIAILEKEVKNEPQNLNKVSEKLSKKFGFEINKRMLIRFLKKKLNYSYRRIRKWLKPNQCKIEYIVKIVHLCGLLWLEKQGLIKIYYGDESGFTMNSYLPSAWQEKGNHLAIVPNKYARINVFGLMSRDMDFYAYTLKSSIDSTVVISFIDQFIKERKSPQKTVLVLDNASMHTSAEFEAEIERWEEEDVYIFYLPKYAPHLNLIETLWRKIKYEWLKQHHFIGSDFFFASLDAILKKIGSEYTINFKDQLLPN